MYVFSQVEALAADVREALCRVSELPFDETASANVPTVAYEVRIVWWFMTKVMKCV